MTLINRVRRTLKRHQLATSSTRVVAALSGGPDSMALLHVLRALDEAHELSLVAIAHLNHQLRAAAGADEQFCSEVASAFGLPFVVERIDVQTAALAEQRSLEDAAHVVRHAFFARAAALHGGDAVAVGHSRDDQAETFLLRLLRGAGSRGLAAMHPRNGLVIRPLLDCSRIDIAAFLTEQQLRFVHDGSNEDVGIPRNRVRAELLPLLEERFNPRIREVLAAEAELARADEQFLAQCAADWGNAHVVQHPDGTRTVDAAALAALPQTLAWRVLHRMMRVAAGGGLIGFEHVERAWAMVAEGAGGFDAPGHRVERVGPNVVLSSSSAGTGGRRPVGSIGSIPAFSHPLPVPGEVAIPEIGCVLSAEDALSPALAAPNEAVVAVVSRDKVAGGLVVRNRRPGDRLRPSAAGHRKLQDLLVDRKVPRAERDRIPIVVDAAGRIVWVAGHAIDVDFRVSDPAQAVVILRLKGVGGSC